MVSKKKTESSEKDVDKETVEVPIGKYFDKVRANPWIASTIVLGVVLVLVLAFGGSGNSTTVSADEASANVLEFLSSNPSITGDLEVVSTEQDGQFYEVTLNYQGQQVPIYTTLDGEFMVQGVYPLAQQETDDTQTTTETTEIPKSDIPTVELFIWSYCPYGVQAQGPLADVAMLLGESADFEGVLYYDGHGEFETQENKIQACIQKVDPENYWAYAKRFVEEVYPVCGQSRDVECDKTESTKLMNSLGIDSDAVFSCVDTEGTSLITEHRQRASELGVTGSPTLVINGVKADVARNAEAFKTAVCSAFNDAPETCSEVLSSSAAATSDAAQC